MKALPLSSKSESLNSKENNEMTDIKTLGVVGAGPMGAGIVQVGLTSGFDVVLFDLSSDASEKARQSVMGHISRMVEKGRLDPSIASTAADRLTLASDLQTFADADIVIEAIIERLEPKQQLFAALEGIVGKETILATNTSSLSVTEIAASCSEKARICGLHFFNPVPLMKLVEVISAPTTSIDTVEQATALSHRLGKTPVTVADGPGFLVNLQGRAYSLESLAVVQEGVATPAIVDRIMRNGAGFRMGPFELQDLTGIDISYAASKFIYEGHQHDPRLKTTTLQALMSAAGLYGRKAGRGYFDYSENVSVDEAPLATTDAPDFTFRFVDDDAAFAPLIEAVGPATGDDITLVAPIGEDCSTVCARLGLDPTTTVAVDLTAIENRHLTLMNAPGGSLAVEQAASWLRGRNFSVETIFDSPGFVLQRVLAMIANLGCELAQTGIGKPDDIDVAMRLAQNYPKGPFEWGDWLGVEKTYEIMDKLFKVTGSDRYRPSLWLRRRAQLGLSIYTNN